VVLPDLVVAGEGVEVLNAFRHQRNGHFLVVQAANCREACAQRLSASTETVTWIV
jgi:hypothetical protein